MYVTEDPLPIGPAVGEQAPPVTPVIDHVPTPVGVWPLTGPATVAVKVKVEPSDAVG